MLTQCIPHPHLADIEQQAQVMFDTLVDQLAKKEGVTEKLKAENQILWMPIRNTGQLHPHWTDGAAAWNQACDLS